ncbi:MAG: VIT family protein [Chitinophagaceae bacterium]|nr:VIT family protein [Chitinophagaceae bacterium]
MPHNLLENLRENHYIHKSAWLRAAVLGANDGILSTASISIGVAAASDIRNPIVLASLAGLVAGALSMAAGEYVSVSSQTDLEQADLDREKMELETQPEIEEAELARIYKIRGLSEETAKQVAKELSAFNALEAHARDELGIYDMTKAKPLQAALASGVAFIFGGIMPLLVSLFMPLKNMIFYQYGFAILFLIILGSVSAKIGGAKVFKAILRVTFWGTIAMLLSALVGYLFGVNMA